MEKDYRTGRVIGLAATAALGGFLFGYDSAVINGAKGAIQNTFSLGDFAIGLVVSIALIGSALGAWFAGRLADRFGRQPVMLMAAALFMAAAIGQAFPFSVYDLVFWRFVGGAGIGVASVMAPMYISEIAPASMRGRMSSLQQFAIVIGIFATSLVNYLILNAAGGNAQNDWLFGLPAWQWMFLSMVIPALIYGLLALRLPESPRYLVQRGKDEQARAVLRQIYTVNPDARVDDIRASMAGDQQSSFADLRGTRFGLMPLVWIGIILSALQQFVGINAVFYYSNTIWESVGFSEDQAFQTSLITTGVNVAFTVVAIALVDRVGRKPLLLVGS
ncbi:MAG: sugar porter family MFS transporter, partial [Actinomycetota bacterium]|nr:sugar porter family MFS transporter [Actinomycetota bacterium]